VKKDLLQEKAEKPSKVASYSMKRRARRQTGLSRTNHSLILKLE
jgi:hypothetical protein